MFVKPFIRTVVDTALKMEAAGRRVQVAMGGVSAVDLRDGLPVDEMDQATVISTLTGGEPTISVERAVAIQIPDPVAQAEELARLDKARAGKVATIFGGPSAGDVQGNSQDAGGSAGAGT